MSSKFPLCTTCFSFSVRCVKGARRKSPYTHYCENSFISTTTFLASKYFFVKTFPRRSKNMCQIVVRSTYRSMTCSSCVDSQISPSPSHTQTVTGFLPRPRTDLDLSCKKTPGQRDRLSALLYGKRFGINNQMLVRH